MHLDSPEQDVLKGLGRLLLDRPLLLQLHHGGQHGLEHCVGFSSAFPGNLGPGGLLLRVNSVLAW